MTKDEAINKMREKGADDAAALRTKANTMTGTEIIAAEIAVPDFDATKDYSACPDGTPVADEGQVNYQGRPSTLRALWGLCHTKDPAKAKAWVAPLGTSGMYMTGECYKDDSGKVHRCLQDNVVYDASALPSAWEDAEWTTTKRP